MYSIFSFCLVYGCLFEKKYQSNKDILLQLGSMSIITSRLVFFLTESPDAHTHTHTNTTPSYLLGDNNLFKYKQYTSNGL